MNLDRSQTTCKERSIPELKFESQRLTSFSGLVILQRLYERTGLLARLQKAFRRNDRGGYGISRLFLLLVTHLILGFRRIRDTEGYRHDPLLKKTVGLSRLPDVSTLSRRLSACDSGRVAAARGVNRELVEDSVEPWGFRRITVDFDGSVQSTRRRAEGTAVGFNRKRKGERSYYPLLCTVAQTGQVYDVHHRSGNVHDSNGASDFMETCLERLRLAFPDAVLEGRADSAFFNEVIVDAWEKVGAEYTFSVPFERFPELKGKVEVRKRWKKADKDLDYFELDWRPDCWTRAAVRLIVVRRRQPRQRKGPLQLDLFEPLDHEYQYSIVATNKDVGAPRVIAFHHGRGGQEGVIGEVRSDMGFGYVPFRRRVANELYMVASILGHNLLRCLQMDEAPTRSNLGWKRPACWVFEKAGSLRMRLFHRAGRLTFPGHKKVLTISGDEEVAKMYSDILERLDKAA